MQTKMNSSTLKTVGQKQTKKKHLAGTCVNAGKHDLDQYCLESEEEEEQTKTLQNKCNCTNFVLLAQTHAAGWKEKF